MFLGERQLSTSGYLSCFTFRLRRIRCNKGIIPLMDQSSRAAKIFLIVFAMPFCGFGLFALLSGSRAAILGGSKQSWALAMAGLVFTIVGGGLLIGGKK